MTIRQELTEKAEVYFIKYGSYALGKTMAIKNLPVDIEKPMNFFFIQYKSSNNRNFCYVQKELIQCI